MQTVKHRNSYHTNTKIFARKGLLSTELLKLIPSSNLSRWLKEPENKYIDYTLNGLIDQDIELFQNQNEFPSSKKLSRAYIQLLKGAYTIFDQIKDFNKVLKKNKDIIVNTIESIKNWISIDEAIKLFRISRATYQNYKIQVLNKCEASYIFWCVKRYPQQLLNQEVIKIKEYFNNSDYKSWSKSSIYYMGLRKKDFSFCLATFYKYSSLLGIDNGRHLQNKPEYSPLLTTKPNQIWCADITIFKTANGVKHYIHLLIDHYSQMILGWYIGLKPSPKAIKELLQNTFKELPKPTTIEFVTDGGVENINTTVKEYIKSIEPNIIHNIAQKDIASSNSMIEAINKTLKYQYLYQLHIENTLQLYNTFPQIIRNYCNIRPQHSLKGNTPFETYNGKTISISHYNSHFQAQKQFRKEQNNKNNCKKCME
ncbi:transposase [Flavobacterium columnare]|uniref:transposase n=1 Tax=Flavobacterium columnare TaxID=996 RepID=UPI003C2ABF43